MYEQHFYIQGPDDGIARSLVHCRACDWGKWSPPTGEAPGARRAAGEAHVATHLLGEDLPFTVSELRDLLSYALKPRCCHTSGMHDPTHYREGRYVCESQKAQAWHRAVLLLGLPTHAEPAHAVSYPRCGWCERHAAGTN